MVSRRAKIAVGLGLSVAAIATTITVLVSKPSPPFKEPAWMGTYPSARAAVAAWEYTGFDPAYDLLKGAWIGGCGYQPDAYDVIDNSFFAQQALVPYYPSTASLIADAVSSALASVGYQGNDRREALFGNQIPVPPLTTEVLTIQGAPPPVDCSSTSPFWLVTEFPTTPITGYAKDMNTLVPAALTEFKFGSVSTAQSLFETALGWWTGVGFLDSGATTRGNFYARDLAYFLILQRATQFPADLAVLSAVEAQMWSLQVSDFDGGLATSYSQTTGKALIGHTSSEINGLALLAYDERLVTDWFP